MRQRCKTDLRRRLNAGVAEQPALPQMAASLPNPDVEVRNAVLKATLQRKLDTLGEIDGDFVAKRT